MTQVTSRNRAPARPAKLSSGDRVAVVSPSFAVPGRAPAQHELAMRRLRDELGLEPVEFPTTRRIGASASDRAADLNAAFADPSIRAVLATIGGDDQITVLPHLDAELVRADPKPFFGFSDNTNLLNWLWFHGVAAYHGGSTQMHLGRGGGTHPVSIGSLRAALFESVDLEITEVDEFGEDDFDWDDERRLTSVPPALAASPWIWHQPESVLRARTWGGNLEILEWVLASDRYVHEPSAYQGCILLLETSEEMPTADEVFRTLRNMGERGLLEQFPAVVVARPKASFVLTPKSFDERARYREAQRAAVLRAVADYHPAAMIVFDVDFGHTDPQWVLPYGGELTIDGPGRRIVAPK
jgi:muramoyltetrapeptide carboxypeptidase LdcA involved in peptidoglycan recycling